MKIVRRRAALGHVSDDRIGTARWPLHIHHLTRASTTWLRAPGWEETAPQRRWTTFPHKNGDVPHRDPKLLGVDRREPPGQTGQNEAVRSGGCSARPGGALERAGVGRLAACRA